MTEFETELIRQLRAIGQLLEQLLVEPLTDEDEQKLKDALDEDLPQV